MLKLSLFISISIIISSCHFTTIQEPFVLSLSKGFPQWLKHTDQTSGNTFIGLDKNGNKNFLLCDDIGKIHRLIISEDTILAIRELKLSESVKSFLKPFPKWDFEEIAFDKKTGELYVSIEGNGELYKHFAGIYSFKFANSDPFSDSLTLIERINFQPNELFLLHISPNIGYEGFTMDENYFYLGLEGFQTGELFADYTIIYLADKKNFQIVDSINTKEYGISTVCGLYSDKNYSLFGIDRNNRKIFQLTLNEKRQVININSVNIESRIPGYEFEYTASLESITIDNGNSIYFIDDPWKKFYVPSKEILEKTDSTTAFNFRNYVPVIYKFNLNY